MIRCTYRHSMYHPPVRATHILVRYLYKKHPLGLVSYRCDECNDICLNYNVKMYMPLATLGE